MPSDPPPDPLFIPARLSVSEAQDHRSRLLGLIAQPGARVIEFTETEGCQFPSAISLQLCLAAMAELKAAGEVPAFGPEATRLLSAQKLM